MKNLVATVALMAMSLVSVAQEWLPKNFTTFNTMEDYVINAEFEEWYYVEESPMFIYLVDHNAVGIKHAYDETFEVLDNAGLDWSNPDIDKSYLASYIDSKFDYGSLSTSINVGGSEVVMIWDHEGYRIAISLKEDHRGVFIIKM